jgi:8-oxo-dGTP diphosphatase
MPSTVADAVVQVAVGIVADRDRFFVTRRPLSTHQGGKWEFPGGKIHAGETTLTALKRELHEELGIDVLTAQPFMQLHHTYPDKSVFLDVWQVVAFAGTPHGREGQEARWAIGEELLSLDFPKADLPIQRRLWLPGLYAISDAARYGREEFLRRLELALNAGLRLLQLREPQMGEAEFLDLARVVATSCHRVGAKLILNADPACVDVVGADGVHLNSRRLMQATTRPLPAELFVAASCHNEQELEQAMSVGADLVVLGPVASTASHPEREVLGWQGFESLCRAARVPVYALGGMQGSDAAIARQCGAHGLAMIRGLWGAADPETVVRACRSMLR